MSQNMSAAPASLGAPPRRHRESQPESSGQILVGTSMSARFGENEWELREVYIIRLISKFMILKNINFFGLVTASARTGRSAGPRSPDGENYEMVVRLYSKLAREMEQGSLPAKLFKKP